MSLGMVAAAVGIAGSAYGAYNSYEGSKKQQSGTGGGGNQYIPQGSGQADQTWQDLLTAMTGGSTGAMNAINPELLKSFQDLLGIDTNALRATGQAAGNAAGVIAGDYSAKGEEFQRQAMRDFAAQQRLQTAGDTLWNTALDPQNALGSKLQQQTVDASRAGTSARGIGMSGNAAGLESDAVNNFLLNWQQQQLGRQATGLQGMEQAYGQGNALGNAGNASMTGGAALTGMIPGLLQQVGMLPYQANVTAAGAPMNYANMFSQAQNSSNGMGGNIMSQIIPYLYAGQGATTAQFGQNQTQLNNLISSLYGPSGNGAFSGSGGNSPWSALGSMFGYYGGSGGQGQEPGGYTSSGYPEGGA